MAADRVISYALNHDWDSKIHPACPRLGPSIAKETLKDKEE
jgi:hypothetical protein